MCMCALGLSMAYLCIPVCSYMSGKNVFVLCAFVYSFFQIVSASPSKTKGNRMGSLPVDHIWQSFFIAPYFNSTSLPTLLYEGKNKQVPSCTISRKVALV